MPQDHQTSAAVDADKPDDDASTAPPPAQPAPLPDPFQFTVLLEQLARKTGQP